MFDPESGKRLARKSCAAIVVQVLQKHDSSEDAVVFSKTFARDPGLEYQLRDALQETVAQAMQLQSSIKKPKPLSCFVFRDGIGEGAFGEYAKEEIEGIRAGLITRDNSMIPLSYTVCQKRIPVKLFVKKSENQEYDCADVGSCVRGIQGLEHDTFYINGTAPPGKTSKPVRFVNAVTDSALQTTSLPDMV